MNPNDNISPFEYLEKLKEEAENHQKYVKQNRDKFQKVCSEKHLEELTASLQCNIDIVNKLNSIK